MKRFTKSTLTSRFLQYRVDIWLFFLLGIVIINLFPNLCHSDLYYWESWAASIKSDGIGQIYSYQISPDMKTNYHPLYLYMLQVYGWFYNSVEYMRQQNIQIKTIAWIFDILTVWSLAMFFKKEKIAFFIPYLLLLNPAFFYNTLIWAQVDSIYTFIAVFSLLFLCRKKIILSIVLMTLALLTKPQTILFLPIYGLVLLTFQNQKWKQTSIGILYSIGIILATLIPFYLADSLVEMKNILFANSNLYPYVSLNAYNFWFLIFGSDSLKTLDSNQFLVISYRIWGILLYGFSSLGSLALALYGGWIFQKKQITEKKFMEVVILATLVSFLCFFFFMTQMHERYSHPLILISFIYFLVSRKPVIYILISVAYFINLEQVSHLMQIPFLDTIYSIWLVCICYVIALILGIIHTYRSILNLRQSTSHSNQ